jgi:DUF4097 and DUF4098 domain-containing protein YvlB
MNAIRMFVPAIGLLLGCSFHAMPFTAKDVVSKSFPVSGTPKVVLDTFNGYIDVMVTDEKTVGAEITRKAAGISQEAAQADLKNIQVTATQEGDTVKIAAKNADPSPFSNRAASIDIHVPVGSLLVLSTSNGRIHSIGLAGDIKAETSNGSIDVKGSRGMVKAETTNGSIKVDGGVGQLDLRSSNGTIRASSTKPVRVAGRTSNGNVDFQGALASGEQVFETSNGSIHLHLPADQQFAIDASTSRGRVTNEFALAATSRKGKSHLEGATGEKPGTTIRAETSNGSVEIKRQK